MTMQPVLELIVAVDDEGGFGRNGQIPWNCPQDFKHFMLESKKCGVCVMGKNTYVDLLEIKHKMGVSDDDIRAKGILPDRVTYVVTSTLTDPIGATAVGDLRAVINRYIDTKQRIAVLGGEKLYVQALASAVAVNLTHIPGNFQCDRALPMEYIHRNFVVDVDHSHEADAEVDGEPSKIRFIYYTRR